MNAAAIGLDVTRLRAEPPPPAEARTSARGDHSLQVDAATFRAPGPPRAAAVLVPVVLHGEAPSILLTERASGLRAHSGQIAFPGGKIDEGDASPLAAALREAREEIGLPSHHVTPLGYLDAYLSSTNFLITPVVGLVAPGFRLAPNPSEVADVFEVPFAFLMDPANHELHLREWMGGIRQYYAMPFGPRYIWGVTAAILRNFYERLHET